MASLWPPKKNVALTWYFFVYKNDGTLIVNPTLASSAVHVDGNVTEVTTSTLAVVDATTGLCSIALAQATMNGDQIDGKIVASDTGAVVTTFKIVTAANTQDEIVAGTVKAKVDVETIKTQAVTCAAGVTVLASVGTAATDTAQTGDAFARLGAPTGASVSADVAAVKADTGAVLLDTGTDGVVVSPASTAAITDAVLDEAMAGHIAAGSLGKAVADTLADTNELQTNQSNWLTATGFATPTNITAGTITTVTNLTNAPTAGDLTATMKASVTAAVPTAIANADALLGRNIAGGSSIGRTVKQVLRLFRNKVTVIAGTMTVYQEDDVTPDWTAAVTEDAAANPIVTIDPA